MAKHFYSYQFDMPYRPTYLRNWEVPKYYCPKPRRRTNCSKIISNSRGHILPGEPRVPCNPFGDFIGTWELPKKITRETANKLNGTTDKPAFMEKCRLALIARPRKGSRSSKKKEELKETSKETVKTVETAPSIKRSDEQNVEKVICPIHDF